MSVKEKLKYQNAAIANELSGLKPSRKGQLNDPATQEIERLWGDLPVVDAEKDLRVTVIQEDIDRAICKDFGACVFAMAAQRLFQTDKVLFCRTVAYVGLPDEHGNRRVERFTMSPKMRELVEEFDNGRRDLPRAAFVLKAPRLGDRLDARRSRKLRAKERESSALRREKILDGTYQRKGNQGIGKYSVPPLAIDISVRNASGRIQFKKTKNAKIPKPVP